jgi:hypothetical protein
MKNKLTLIITISALAFVALACNASFSTANISSFNFSKNESGEPQSTTFNVGEKIYAVANVSNAMGKYKMKFKITPPDNSLPPLDKDIDFEGSRPIYLYFNGPAPGDYKVDATLVDESGKELGKKSGVVNVKGEAATTKPADDKKDADSDADDKDEKK